MDIKMTVFSKMLHLLQCLPNFVLIFIRLYFEIIIFSRVLTGKDEVETGENRITKRTLSWDSNSGDLDSACNIYIYIYIYI